MRGSFQQQITVEAVYQPYAWASIPWILASLITWLVTYLAPDARIFAQAITQLIARVYSFSWILHTLRRHVIVLANRMHHLNPIHVRLHPLFLPRLTHMATVTDKEGERRRKPSPMKKRSGDTDATRPLFLNRFDLSQHKKQTPTEQKNKKSPSNTEYMKKPPIPKAPASSLTTLRHTTRQRNEPMKY